MVDSRGAEKILQPLEKKVADFEIINREIRIVNNISDNASVIKKWSKICHVD